MNPSSCSRSNPHACPKDRRAGEAPVADAAMLRIGGITRLTTIDYPGELAAVVFCQGCPWRCRYCHNPDLLDSDEAARIHWSEVKQFLTQRLGLLDAVVFSGGEPTAQQALGAAMREVHALGFKVGLHTSGAYPERLRDLLPLLDWVGMDIKALPADYGAITGVTGSGKLAWKSLSLLLDAGIPLEVRTTVPPDWTAEQVTPLGHALADAGVRVYCLQGCDTDHALDRSLQKSHLPLRQLAQQLDIERFFSVVLR